MRSLRGADGPGRRAVVGFVLAASALLVPPASLAFLQGFPRFDVVLQSPDVHLAVVGGISACAFGVALAAVAAARRTGQGALVVLAAGCMAVGAFMLAHGLTTPGVAGRPVNLWVARLPVLAIAAFAVSLTLAALPRSSPALTAAARFPFAVLGGAAALLVTFSTVVVLWPAAWIGAAPLEHEWAAHAVLLWGSALALLISGAVHARRWRLGHDAMQLAVVVACWQGVGAVLSLRLGELWHLAWWDYHVFLLVGFSAAVVAIVQGSRRDRSLDEVLGAVFSTDPLEHIARGYSEVLRALVAAVEARDTYTHGHSVRVAEWSVRIGVRLRLRPRQLRTCADGAYLHDVGKIGVPDSILNKPGRLTEEERGWIEQHPVVGVDIAGRATSLLPALDMIRHHHERYDGGGYPDGLAGDDIPLLARIVAVADVWDALTSDRSYRPAWAPEDALAHMIDGRGSHFDPRCLDVLVELLAERGIRPADATCGDARVARAATAACHASAHGHAHDEAPVGTPAA
jgi:HD-GYP domain-containing protein (c-di-GMP phosphodiesterase class II)